jgi:hypothetical protein
LSYTDNNGIVNQTQFSYLGNALCRVYKTQKNGNNTTCTQDSHYVPDGFGFQILQEKKAGWMPWDPWTLINEYTYGLGLPGGIGGLLHLQQGGASGPE